MGWLLFALLEIVYWRWLLARRRRRRLLQIFERLAEAARDPSANEVEECDGA
jgi:hypothetical protein